jgi:hypothetical protein
MDGGVTWTAVNNGIPGQANNISVGAVWVDPGDPNVIFAANGSALFRSSDAGACWANVAAGNPYSIDPHRPGVLYAGTTGGLYQSADSGNSFTLRLAGITTVLAAAPTATPFPQTPARES